MRLLRNIFELLSGKNRPAKDYFLSLPDAPDFISKPPRLSMSEYIKLCEELLPMELARRERVEELPIITEEFYL